MNEGLIVGVALRLIDLAYDLWLASGRSKEEWDLAYAEHMAKGMERDPSTLPKPPKIE